MARVWSWTIGSVFAAQFFHSFRVAVPSHGFLGQCVLIGPIRFVSHWAEAIEKHHRFPHTTSLLTCASLMVSRSRILSTLRAQLRVFALVLCAVFPASVSHATELAETNPETLILDQEIHAVRERLSQVAIELRDAKLLATEKLMEFEVARDQYQLHDTQVNANTMEHSQQRLALAEMGVEARSAKFDRIQKKLEELAQLRQQMSGQTVEPQLQTQLMVTETPATKPPTIFDAVALPTAAKSDPPKPAIAQSEQPVISVQGKVNDAVELNAQLQKLERHLMAAGSTADPAIKVKAYGTAIPGELILSPLGGNQYFARFIAPAGQVSLIIGARLQQYLRNAVELEFSPEEKGKEFVLIFDMNQPEDTRVLVFPETMMFEQEMFAAHNDY